MTFIFWRYGKAHEVLSILRSLKRKAAKLSTFEGKASLLRANILEIQNSINYILDNLIQRALDEKDKLWVDSKFNPQIDAITEMEIAHLHKLEQDLKEYEGLVLISATHEDLEIVLEELQNEVNTIELREETTEKTFKYFETRTLNERMSILSVSPSSLKTSDGIPWKNITYVIRQLGAWIEPTRGGRHPYKIRFQSGAAIPLSEDIHSGIIALGIRKYLAALGKKVPSINKFIAAFKAGDIHYLN